MYRNNFIFTCSNFGNKSEIGIYKKKKSRVVIPCEEIGIANPRSRIIARQILNWLTVNELDKIYDFDTKDGYLHNISVRNNIKDEFMVEIYLHDNPNINDFVSKINKFPFSEYNIISAYVQIFNKHHDFREKFNKIYGVDFLDYHFDNKIISIYPGAFFQTNNNVLFDMYNDIIKYMDKKPNIFFDLYCGVGVMSILVNDYYSKCYGIEINSNSIEMAKLNVQQNNINNCEFICNPVEEIINNIVNNLSEDVTIFVNPPRSGLRENVIEELNKIKKYVKQIIYLSCSEKTLDKDIKLFNYSSKIIKRYNMFIDTGHTEILCILK